MAVLISRSSRPLVCACLLVWTIEIQAFGEHRIQRLRGIRDLHVHQNSSLQIRNVSAAVSATHGQIFLHVSTKNAEQTILMILLLGGGVVLAFCFVQPWDNPDDDLPPPIYSIQEDTRRVKMTLKGHGGYHDADAVLYYLMSVSWFALALILFEAYVVIASFFALLLTLQETSLNVGDFPVRFLDAFNFSIQTLATIGYGKLLPNTGWGHTIVMVESYCGLAMVAIGGGIMYSRVNRPTSCLKLSDIVVISESADGLPEIRVRMMNRRVNVAWLDANATISAVIQEGNSRTLRPLKLLRSWNPVLRGSWVLEHTVDPESPLHDRCRVKDADQSLLALVVFVSGVDAIFHQNLYAHQVYYTNQFKFDSTFEQMVEFVDGGIALNEDKLSSHRHSFKETRSLGRMSTLMF